MEKVAHILQAHPELAVFLTLSLGFALGHIKIGSFKIGVVLGTLFAGVLIGQLNIEIPPIVKTIFFDFFLFATGYKVGPQFFQG
jgi:putative transport protein